MHSSDLLAPRPPWVAIWTAESDAAATALWAFRESASAAGVFVGALRAWKARRREGLFEEAGALLQFPRYFGENWNAFADCLRDLDWLRTRGFLLVVFDADELLADGDADELELFLKIAVDCGQAWARGDPFQGPRPFHLLLQSTPGHASALSARLPDPSLPLIEL